MNPFSNRQPQYIPLDQQSEGDDGEVMIEVDADKHSHPISQMPLPGSNSIYPISTAVTELPPSYPLDELRSTSPLRASTPSQPVLSTPSAPSVTSSTQQPHIHCAECDALTQKRRNEFNDTVQTIGWTAFGGVVLFTFGWWILLVIRARHGYCDGGKS